jgi:hypothetical protein
MNQSQIEKFGKELNKLIASHHCLYQLPCMAEFAEELVSKALSSASIPNEWHPIRSHAISTDIVGENGTTFSVKSGAFSKNKGELVISGSRLGKHGNLTDMVNAVLATSADYYICLARDKQDWEPYPLENEGKIYFLFVFPKSALDYRAGPWVKVVGRSGTSFTYEMEGAGIKASIRPSMSHQLWTSVNISRTGEPLQVTIK